MPLIKGKSKKSFEHNVKAEMDAGKPQDQSLAIAYSVKRKAQHKARGGQMNPKLEESHKEPGHKHDLDCGHYGMGSRCKYALGGAVDTTPHKEYSTSEDASMRASHNYGDRTYSPEPSPRKPNDHRLPMDEYMANHFAEGGSVADAIMKSRSSNHEVDENPEEEPNYYDDLNVEAVGKVYDDDQLSDQPMDSNEHGDDIPSDEHDHIDKIRKHMRMRRS